MISSGLVITLWVLGTLIALALLSQVVDGEGLPRVRSRDVDGYPYEQQVEFLSAAERSFYGVLRQAVREDRVVLVKVRLADLVRVDPLVRGRSFWHYFNKISGKHIDFVVCDAATMEPVCCVELDDRSHEDRRRQERDRFVDGVLEAAGVRLVRVPCRASYSVGEIGELVDGGGVTAPEAQEVLPLV